MANDNFLSKRQSNGIVQTIYFGLQLLSLIMGISMITSEVAFAREDCYKIVNIENIDVTILFYCNSPPDPQVLSGQLSAIKKALADSTIRSKVNTIEIFSSQKFRGNIVALQGVEKYSGRYVVRIGEDSVDADKLKKFLLKRFAMDQQSKQRQEAEQKVRDAEVARRNQFLENLTGDAAK